MGASPRTYEVLITSGAEQDLESIYDYVAEYDSVESANHVLNQVMAAVDKLAAFPERGSFPKELSAVGIQEYRQVFFKPYRLIYRVIDDNVVIYVIVDGRRELQGLLARRLLGG